MSDFGGKLRQARERRGVSLRQIAASTKISVGALEALERNDVSKLPGGIFSRAFVRSYAIEVGLDPEDTVREFFERFHGEPTTPVAAAPRVTEEESSFESQQRMASVVLKLVIISIPLVGVILYFTLRQQPPANPPADVQAPQAMSQPATPRSQAPATPAAADPRAVATPRPPASVTPGAAQAGPMRLELHPTGACWITLTVDGRELFSRVMQPGERETHDVRESAVITVGDAGAFAFSIDGRPGRALGEAGQVRTARITRETLADYIR